jgi:hypothetical protein
MPVKWLKRQVDQHVLLCALLPCWPPRQIIEGVEYSLELCSTANVGGVSSLLRMGFGSVSSASSHQVAASFVNDKIRKALEAAHVAGDIVSALQVC